MVINLSLVGVAHIINALAYMIIIVIPIESNKNV